ncbi:hypothetical protein NPIL_603771 [Nephila pilipes]|uniref:Uncharacterized protein n=1 Tax=Nephila pilipes TaxID=299642 RepID=A0A8X6UE00_NEPPI|nr:hypothetical protein NPIL_603771 [Nephila pilipes]
MEIHLCLFSKCVSYIVTFSKVKDLVSLRFRKIYLPLHQRSPSHLPLYAVSSFTFPLKFANQVSTSLATGLLSLPTGSAFPSTHLIFWPIEIVCTSEFERAILCRKAD